MNVAVVSGTAPIHAETFAMAMGGRISASPHCAPWALIVGVSPQSSGLVEELRSKGTKVIGYWIGTDSLCAISDAQYRAGICEYDFHIAVHSRIVEELKSWQIQAEEVWPCVRVVSGDLPMNGKCIGVYDPTPASGDLYMHDTCVEVAQRHPELSFLFYGNLGEPVELPSNCIDAGRKSPGECEDLYARMSILLRLTLHDGFPIGAMDAKMRGRHVIENYPYPGFLYAATVEDVSRYITNEAFHKGDYVWSSWYREHCSPATFRKKIESICSAHG